jgi:hypothetical protein
MSKHRFARLAMLVAALMLPVTASFAADAKKKEEEFAREVVAKPLNAVSELMKEKKFAEARAKIDEADAAKEKTPYETFIIDRTRAAVAQSSGDTPGLIKALEALLATTRLDPTDRPVFMKTLFANYYNNKEYAKVIPWVLQYQKEGFKDEQAHELLLRAYYFTNDYASTVKELRAEFAALAAVGKIPPEDKLNMLQNCGAKSKDKAIYAEALDLLVTHYPTPEYWEDVLSRLKVDERLDLDAYRLRILALKALSEDEYRDMALLSTTAALPAEAKKALETGFKNGVLSSGGKSADSKKLLEKATKSAADDLKSIAQGEATALKSKEGNGLMNVGMAYVTHGQFDKGIALLEQGLKVGKLKQPEEAKLHLAEAYIMANRKDDAIATLKTLAGGGGMPELVRYWMIYLKNAK